MAEEVGGGGGGRSSCRSCCAASQLGSRIYTSTSVVVQVWYPARFVVFVFCFMYFLGIWRCIWLFGVIQGCFFRDGFLWWVRIFLSVRVVAVSDCVFLLCSTFSVGHYNMHISAILPSPQSCFCPRLDSVSRLLLLRFVVLFFLMGLVRFV